MVRTILNTDFPVVNTLCRWAPAGRRPQWSITVGLCNGIPDGASPTFRTRRAALAWAQERGLVVEARTLPR